DYQTATSRILEQFNDTPLEDFEAQAESAINVLAGKKNNPLPAVTEGIRKALSSGAASAKEACRLGQREIDSFVERCRLEQANLRKKIDDEAERLRKKGIKLDLNFLKTLASGVDELEREKNKQELALKRLKLLKRDREKLLEQFASIHSKIFAVR